MKGSRELAIVAVAAGLLAGPVARGQQTAGSPPAAKLPVELLRHVPADCMGFVLVRNVAACTERMEAFVQRISPRPPGAPPAKPGELLARIREETDLGEGFNPQGPFAAVLLDTQQYGGDLVTLLAGPAEGAEPPAAPPELPLVLLVPGRDPARMLGAHEPKTEGELVTWTQDGTKLYARQVGGHVALGPIAKAVEAVATGKTSVLGKLSASDKALLAGHDAAAWVSFETLGPILDAAIARMEGRRRALAGKPAAPDEPIVLDPGKMLLLAVQPSQMTDLREQLRQMSDVGVGVRFSPDAAALEVRLTYRPDTPVGKALAAHKAEAPPVLGRLPGPPYALVLGSRQTPRMPTEHYARQIDRFLGDEPCKALPAEHKAKLRAVLMEMAQQLQAVQLWLGPGAEGQGALRLAVVMECESAGKVRALLPDAVACIRELLRLSGEPEEKTLTVAHRPGAAAIGERKADAIAVTSTDAGVRKDLRHVFGAERVELLVVQADPKTLVITVGGGEAFARAALTTATRRGGAMYEDPAVKAALAELPRTPPVVALVNARQVQAIVAAARAAGGAKPLPVKIDSDAPLAVAGYVEGTDVRAVVRVPAETLKQVIQVFVALIAQQLREAMEQGPPPGGL